MKSKNIKILVENDIVDATVEDDNHFTGGKKVTYKDKNGTTCLISISLVNIIEDEHTGSPRD